jgi:PAS domain S-box-containing protein
MTKIINSIFLTVFLSSLFSCYNSEIITKNEKEWLKKHPNLVVGLSPNAPPYQFVNEKGEISGIFIDFLTIIENKIDYKFKRIYQSDFSKLLNDTKEGAVDILLEVQETEERKTFLNFTPYLLAHNHIIVVKKSENNIENIVDLKSKSIAVVNKYAIQEYLSKNYPDYKLLPLIDDVACLREVSTGLSDAFICQQAVATYYIEKEGISNLKIAGEFNYSNKLAIASRKDLDTLNIILTKAVNSISKNEKLKIYNNWLSYTIKPFYHETRFLILISLTILIVVIIIVLFNLTLQKRVKQKTNELRIAKEKAEKSEQHNQMLFEILPVGLALTKMTGELIYVNKEFTKIIGYSETETLKLSYWDITPQTYAKQEQIQLNSLNSTGFYGPYEKEYIHKSGELIPVRLIGRIVMINDEIFIWSSIENISEKRKNEQELVKAKEKAEESDRLKTAFLQNMSHEIRTPLNAISGFSGMLNKPELSEEKRKSFISIIQNSSKHLISIVSDILTISFLETHQEKLNIAKVCINNLILDLLAIFKQQAQNQNISLYAKQELNDTQSEIYTDKTKITQILTNLLTNALKFTHEGFIEFGYKLKKYELEFYVKDSGIGIKPEFNEKIFERFRQADQSINKLYGGTGLGLSISKAFAELLGGKIWVHSELEKGSTFYFTIPYKPVNEIDKTTPPTKQKENSKTVLVAEDEEYNFLFIEELLIDLDLKIIHTKDGKETVEIFKSNPNIDLILMDIKMPIMTGHEAAKIIKELKPELPIVAQSAYALGHERAKYEGIFNDYLIKPINEDDLKQMVMKYINIEKEK